MSAELNTLDWSNILTYCNTAWSADKTNLWILGVKTEYKSKIGQVNLPTLTQEIIDYLAEFSTESFRIDLTVKIAPYAFQDLSNLSSVTLGATIINIGNFAFNNCTNLSNFSIVAQLNSNYLDVHEELVIGFGALHGCNITNIELPFIGDQRNAKYGFFGYIFGARSPEEHLLYVPKTVQTVKISGFVVQHNEAVYSTDELGNIIQSSEIKEYIAFKLYKKSFYLCSNLQYVFLPNRTWPKAFESFEIPDDCFNGCVNLNYFGANTIEKYNTLDLVSFVYDGKTSLKQIGERAFYNCLNIYTVLLPQLSVDLTRKGVPRIGINAFTGCFNLVGVYGNGLVGIQQAFLGSTLNGDIFTYAAELGKQPDMPELPSTGIYPESYLNDDGFKLPEYNSDTKLNNQLMIQDSIYYIPTTWEGEDVKTFKTAIAFAACNSAVVDLELKQYASADTKIKDYAFSNMAMQTVHINEGITEIGDYSFNNCPNLETVYLPASLEKLGAYTFSNCPNLKTVYYAGTFDNWCDLEFGIFHQLFTQATDVVFGGTQYLTGNKQDNKVTADNIIAYTTKIPAYAFYNFKHAYCNVTLTPEDEEATENLITIEDYAFANSSKLKIILGKNTAQTVQSDIKAIGYKAFENNIISFIAGEDATTGTELGLIPYTLGSWLMDIKLPRFEGSLIDILSRKNYTVSCIIPTSIKYIKEDVFKNIRQQLNNTQSQIDDPDIKITMRAKYAGSLDAWYNIVFANAWSNPMYQDFVGLSSNAIQSEFYFNTGDADNPSFSLCTALNLNDATKISSFAFAGFDLDEVSVCNADISDVTVFANSKIAHAITSPANSPLIANDELQTLTLVLFESDDVLVPANAFASCKKLNKVYLEHANSYTGLAEFEFGVNAFLNCTQIESVHFDRDISSWCQIGFQNAYANPCFLNIVNFYCNNTQIATAIELDNITKIKSFTICNLPILESIILNSEILTFEEQWLLKCYHVTTLKYADTVTANNNTFKVLNNSVCKLNDPDTLAYKLITTTAGTNFAEVATYNINALASGSISCYADTELTLSDAITQIDAGAIDASLSLTHLTIPFLGDSVDTDANAFLGYVFGAPNAYENASYVPRTLNTVCITNSTRFEDRAFYNCQGLQHVYTSSDLSFVGTDVFTGCNIQDPLFYSYEDYCNSTKVHPTMLYSFPNSMLTDGTLIISYPIYDYAGQNIPLDSEARIKLKIQSTHPISIGQYAFKNCKVITGLDSSTFDHELVIEKHAFYGCKNLNEVLFSDKLSKIGTEAFYKCTSLTKLTVPNTVTNEDNADELKSSTIGANVFKGCDNLKDITMPTALSPYISKTNLETVKLTAGTYVRTAAFNNCKMLKKVELADSITAIREQAFKGCILLHTCDLTHVTEVDSEAFLNCVSLYNIGVISDDLLDYLNQPSVTEAFLNCPKLVEICLDTSNKLTSIEADVYGADRTRYNSLFEFAAYEDLYVKGSSSKITQSGQLIVFKETIVLAMVDITTGDAISKLIIPEGITAIHQYAFVNSSGLESVQIPTTLQTIDSYAFYSCDKFTSFTIDNSKMLDTYNLNTIADYAFLSSGVEKTTDILLSKFEQLNTLNASVFDSCTKLTHIFIPHNITTVIASAFKNCPNITTITAAPNHAIYGKTAFNTLVQKYKTEGDTDHYEVLLGCSTSILPLDINITRIAASAFAGCTQLFELIVPHTLLTIELDAFAGCTSLDTITFDGMPAIIKIEQSAFKDCAKLTELDLSQCTNLKIIEAEAFSGCNKLATVKLPPQIEELHTQAFAYCALKNITLPRREKELDGLTEIIGLKTVGGYVFVGNPATLCIYYDNLLPNSYNTTTTNSTEPGAWKNTWNYKSQSDNTTYTVMPIPV